MSQQRWRLNSLNKTASIEYQQDGRWMNFGFRIRSFLEVAFHGRVEIEVGNEVINSMPIEQMEENRFAVWGLWFPRVECRSSWSQILMLPVSECCGGSLSVYFTTELERVPPPLPVVQEWEINTQSHRAIIRTPHQPDIALQLDSIEEQLHERRTATITVEFRQPILRGESEPRFRQDAIEQHNGLTLYSDAVLEVGRRIFLCFAADVSSRLEPRSIAMRHFRLQLRAIDRRYEQHGNTHTLRFTTQLPAPNDERRSAAQVALDRYESSHAEITTFGFNQQRQFVEIERSLEYDQRIMEAFREQIASEQTAKLDRPNTCTGCIDYHGETYQGTQLICGIHPCGYEGDKCPDWRGSK